jgi:DNA-binding MarR family transcriptional regulator
MPTEQRSRAAQKALIDALLSASRTLVGISARSLANLDADVTLPQYRALVILATDGPLRGVDMARELDVAPSTTTRMLDRLVRKDLVRRYHRGDDRRAIWIALTESGKELVGAVLRQRRTEIARLVSSARIDGNAPALEVLDAFVAAAGELPDSQWWRRWAKAAQVPDDVWPAEPGAPNETLRLATDRRSGPVHPHGENGSRHRSANQNSP